MKTAIKIFAAVLAALFLFASCQSGADKNQTENAKTGDEAQTDEAAADSGGGIFYDEVPALDFGGYEYRVLIGTYDRENQDLYPEAEIGEVLNDAIYARNKKVEERFNFAFKQNTVNLWDLLSTLRKNVKAGSDAYDSYMQIDRDAYTSASEHLLHPADELPYVDFKKPYWCPSSNQNLSVAGRLHWAFSDEMLSHFEYTVTLYFNKKHVQDLGLPNIYELVRGGGWTHDRFFEFAKAAVKDLDGDGKMTETDIWGIASEADYMYACFTVCSGVNMVEKDDNDIPYFAVPGNQRFFDIAENVVDAFGSVKGIFMNSWKDKISSHGAQGTPGRVNFFRNGQSLFSVGALQEMVQLRDMPDDFGIIPFPKYNEEQPQYYTRIIGGFPFVTPATIARPEIAGAIMEAMACETRNTVIPAYYESALKNKYSRDPDTAEMLDLMFVTKVYDLGDTIWYSPIRVDYTAIFEAGKTTFASHTEKNADKYARIIDKAVSAILER